MPTGQVSVWVPIVVGAIGLIGVIAGQLINAWREDRRWKHEKAHEEVRWRRESERERTRIAHESTIDWRDRRIEIYGRLLREVSEIDQVAQQAARAKDSEALEAIRDRWVELHALCLGTAQRAQLVSSDALARLLNNHGIRTGWLQIPVVELAILRGHSPEKAQPKHRESMRKACNDPYKYYLRLLEVMRRELACEHSSAS